MVALGIFVLAAIGCNKDDKTDPTPPGGQDTTGTGGNDTTGTGTDSTDKRVAVISAAKWNIDSIGLDFNDDGKMDSVFRLAPCAKDNTLLFNDDSTGVFDEAAAKCNTSDPQTANYNWNFKGSDSLVIDGTVPGDLVGNIKLLTLNDSVLVMTKFFSLTPATSDKLIIALNNK